MLLCLFRTKPTPKWAHTQLCPALGTTSRVNISTGERSPANAPLWAETSTDRHRYSAQAPKHTSARSYHGITVKQFLPEVLAVASVCGWSWRFFCYFFIIAPSFLINKATTSSNCPGISIASSPHDLSTFNSNFILTVPKLQRNTMMLSHSWETQTTELNYLPMVKDHGCLEPCGSTLDHRDMLHYH